MRRAAKDANYAQRRRGEDRTTTAVSARMEKASVTTDKDSEFQRLAYVT
jgi:hypothetical protein